MKELKVFYMFNGLIVIAERINNDQNALQVRQALALAPGQQKGVMSLMEAFPFTAMDEVITLERGSFITMTELADPKIAESYNDALTQIRGKKAGIILP
jgi:hypothetical protein